MITNSSIDRLNNALSGYSSKFKNSMGVRSKQGLNGRSSVFETLKFFDMHSDLRTLVKECLGEEDLQEAIEVYFLRFPEGGFLDDYKAVPTCFLSCEAILLTERANVTISKKEYSLVKGDTITIPLKEVHSVGLALELTDFLVLLKIKT